MGIILWVIPTKNWANGSCFFHLAKQNNMSPTWIFMDFPEIKGDYPSYSLSFGVLGGVFGRYNLTSWEQNEVWFS